MKPRGGVATCIYLLVGLLLSGLLAVAHQTLICDYCRRLISGQYVVSDGKNYHVGCYENHVALRCALCGEIINGQYFEDFWGNRVHAEHKDKVPQCLYCRRFISEEISKGMVKYDDGRIVCGICAGDAINDAVTAGRIMSDLQEHLFCLGIDTKDMKEGYARNGPHVIRFDAGELQFPLGIKQDGKDKVWLWRFIVQVEYNQYMVDGKAVFEKERKEFTWSAPKDKLLMLIPKEPPVQSNIGAGIFSSFWGNSSSNTEKEQEAPNVNSIDAYTI